MSNYPDNMDWAVHDDAFGYPTEYDIPQAAYTLAALAELCRRSPSLVNSYTHDALETDLFEACSAVETDRNDAQEMADEAAAWAKSASIFKLCEEAAKLAAPVTA